MRGNIYNNSSSYNNSNSSSKEEVFTELLRRQNVLIERIASTGQTTPENQPYCQEQDEWVIVLQGEAHLKIDDNTYVLKQGDYLFIPHHKPHWVTYTTARPATIWLAVHIFEKSIEKTTI